MHDLNMAQHAHNCDQPFDCPCPVCGKGELLSTIIAYDAEIKHDGRLYLFPIPRLQVNKCSACGEVFFDAATDDQISQALREHLNLLSPQQIRQRLQALGLMQKEFGERIGVAPETISRWLSGSHIQSRAMDNLMRLFLELDSVRDRLAALTPAAP
jgi:putative zinc finger/helix-turn-helix YgiT family protein